MKTQIFFIHGGMTFKNRKDYLHFLKTREIRFEDKKRWSGEYLKKSLGKDFEVIKPEMPIWENAKYADWKLNFERCHPFMKNNLILIGHSLGGIFLAKYLSENKFPKKILSTYLIAPPFDDTLPGEDLVGGFKLKSDLKLIEKNSPHLNLFFSKNDEVVPLAHAEKFRKKLKTAKITIFENNGHFQIPEFPEIIKMIKADLKGSSKNTRFKNSV